MFPRSGPLMRLAWSPCILGVGMGLNPVRDLFPGGDALKSGRLVGGIPSGKLT